MECNQSVKGGADGITINILKNLDSPLVFLRTGVRQESISSATGNVFRDGPKRLSAHCADRLAAMLAIDVIFFLLTRMFFLSQPIEV